MRIINVHSSSGHQSSTLRSTICDSYSVVLVSLILFLVCICLLSPLLAHVICHKPYLIMFGFFIMFQMIKCSVHLNMLMCAGQPCVLCLCLFFVSLQKKKKNRSYI